MTKLFLDTEFTGLHQKTSLISIGLVSECGKTFYAEFTDYNKKYVDDWIQKNVISNLILQDKITNEDGNYAWKNDGENQFLKFEGIGVSWMVKLWLETWLNQFHKVEIISDCFAYDWVLFCELFGGAFNVPETVYYIPYDICTMFKTCGIDPDINREYFAYGENAPEGKKHNALWDAHVIKDCFDKMVLKHNLNF